MFQSKYIDKRQNVVVFDRIVGLPGLKSARIRGQQEKSKKKILLAITDILVTAGHLFDECLYQKNMVAN